MSYYAHGQWNATCDQCDGTFKSGALRKMWNGLYACSRCWEPRQPQDFVRAVKDGSPPSWQRGQAFITTQTTIPGTLTSTTTSIATVDGSAFSSTYPYNCVIQLGTVQDLVTVTGKAVNTFTVTRGVVDTPKAFAANAYFTLA